MSKNDLVKGNVMTKEGDNKSTGEPHYWVPVPDPTERTLEVLEREVQSLHDKLQTKTSALSSELHSAMEHREKLTDTKFAAVKLQFDLIESGRMEQKTDTKAAVDAALIAQKEAVKEQTIASEKSISKSETATTESIKQMSQTFTTAIESVNRAISDQKESATRSLGDLKERVSAIEAQRHGDPLRERVVGMESQKLGAKDNTAAIFAALAAFIGVVAIIMGVMNMFAK